MRADRTTPGRLTVAAAVVVTVWVAYSLASAWWFGASAKEVAPYVYAPLLIVGGAVAGRRLSARVTARQAAVAVAIVGGWLLIGVLTTELPGKRPLGYANANAALGVQVLALGGLVALRRRAGLLAWVAVALAIGALLANRSVAGNTVAVVVALTIGYAVVAAPGRRRWVAATLSVASLATVTGVLVALSRRAAWPEPALQAFDEVRRLLWLQAWGAFRQAETAGRGPGSFESLNILKDPDQTSAHSLPLQVAVELGGVGVVLLVLLFLVGLGIALAAASPAQSWVVVAAWTALAVHAYVDHLLEFWPVPLAAGLVLGYGQIAESDADREHEPVELAGTSPGST